jgi:hypothetical protein
MRNAPGDNLSAARRESGLRRGSLALLERQVPAEALEHELRAFEIRGAPRAWEIERE